MNTWLLRARWWQVGLVSAVPLGIVFALVERFAGDESWTVSFAVGAVTGPLCGGIVGALSTARLREGAESLPPETHARVDRATRRGPVPEDPEERAAAHRLLTHRLARIRETRTRSLVVQVGLAVVGSTLALGSTSWWWLVVALAVVLLVSSPLLVGRLERRVELLAEPPD